VKILVLTDRFVPEVTAPSVRIMDHARLWLEDGHEVTVVTCAPNVPDGVVFDGYQNKLYQEEWIEGVRTIRVWSYMTANEGFLKRTLDYLSYMVSVTLQAGRYPEFDVILATSPPLFTAMAGYAVGKLRRRPWVFEIRDLWPASIQAVGASSGAIIPWLERIELFLYRKAPRIISLTRSFKEDLVGRGISADKNDVVTNSVDLRIFNSDAVGFDARERLGVPADAFVAGYIGTLGMAHGLATVLDAAEMLKEDDGVRLVIMGNGAERAGLEADAMRRGLHNLVFHDFVPHDEMPAYLAALDASLVHLRPDPLFHTVIPSKIFEAMAMGLPILMGVEGESAEIVADSDCGICFPSGDSAAMVEATRRLVADPELGKRLGRNGQEAARTNYSRRPNATAVVKSLQTAIDVYGANRVQHG
jgi:glycosyltransferase involved in cell wall biosynthesis